VASLVVAAGLMSGVVETLPEPCVMLASDDGAAVVVVAPPGAAGVLAAGSVDAPLPVFASCAIAAVPSRAAATTMESFNIALTFGLERQLQRPRHFRGPRIFSHTEQSIAFLGYTPQRTQSFTPYEAVHSNML